MISFLLLCSWVALAFAQAPQDPVRDFCRRYGHQTAIIDRKLFIDGGWLYANPISQNPVPTINQGLLYGDLDKPNEYNFPTVYANLAKNNSIPDVSGGILWADQVNKVLWLYGGEFSTAPSAFQLWGYDVVLNQWNLSSATTTTSNAIQRVAYGAGTTVNELGKGYYYGGYLNKLTNPLWSGSPYATNSLIVFDMDHNILTNKTGPSDGIGRAEGVMVSIPASASGVLVYFGGVSYPYANTTEVPQSLEYIMLYDIADEKWYKQKTAGDIPANRRHFCGGVTWAPDKSSYNVYIYGGFGFAENATGFDDVYILTMPTFQWIKWYPEPGAATRPHGLLSCDVIANSQMIVMGGNFTQDNDCDTSNVMGMHNLDLGQSNVNEAKWYQYLPNVTSYVVPPAIISAVGGSGTGGATKSSPVSGWSDPAIEVYFDGKAQYQARAPTRSLPSSTGIANPSTPSNDKSGIGPIVGGAVGGLVVIVTIVTALLWCRRRRRRRTQKSQPAAQVALPGSTPATTRPELSGVSQRDAKAQSITQIVGSPASSQSPGPPPFSTTSLMPPMMAPVYPYQNQYPPHDPAHQQYYQGRISPQYQYSQYPMHGYPQHHPDAITPPESWIQHAPHPPQQYFPPPDARRMSPPAQEMPTVMSPPPHQMQQPTMYYPAPIRSSQTLSYPIRRREVGGATSPTETTVTHTSDSGSRVY